ncbi:hypothetical protein D3C86_2265730 [compost metagenome]
MAHFWLNGDLSQQFLNTPFISSTQVLVIAPVLIALGAGLAGISSLLTLRRYLKV